MSAAGFVPAEALDTADALVPVVVVMGVSGSGKTTFGQALAATHGFRFLDADRAPWLQRLAGLLAQAEEPTVLACSALKARYREELAARCPQALFVHLAGSRVLIGARLAARSDHDMPPSLLDSQLNALEAPGRNGSSPTLSCDRPVADLCEAVLAALAERYGGMARSPLPNDAHSR